jgi:hypothetical protein
VRIGLRPKAGESPFSSNLSATGSTPKRERRGNRGWRTWPSSLCAASALVCGEREETQKKTGRKSHAKPQRRQDKTAEGIATKDRKEHRETNRRQELQSQVRRQSHFDRRLKIDREGIDYRAV